MPRPSHPPRLHCSNNTWRRVQIMKLFIMQFSPVTSSLFGPNIHLSTLFSNTTSPWSTLNDRDCNKDINNTKTKEVDSECYALWSEPKQEDTWRQFHSTKAMIKRHTVTVRVGHSFLASNTRFAKRKWKLLLLVCKAESITSSSTANGVLQRWQYMRKNTNSLWALQYFVFRFWEIDLRVR
jgi:hypothetical protein